MKQVRQISVEEQIEAIIEVSRKISQSKETVNKFLRDAGILDVTSPKAKKAPGQPKKK